MSDVRSDLRPGADARYDPSPVNVRVRLSASWAAMVLVFAFVDLFGLYRADVRADIEAGEIGGFAIGQSFLLAATLYVAVPSAMVVASLVLPARASRTTNLVLAPLYAVTIVVSAVGEWAYYVAGSAIEVVLLAIITFHAWTWPAPERRDS